MSCMLDSLLTRECAAACAANELPLFHITVDTEGSKIGYSARFANSIDAAVDGHAQLQGRAGVVRVRPDVEQSFLDGKARWPDELHPAASDEARHGWCSRELMALVADVNNNRTKIHRAQQDAEDLDFKQWPMVPGARGPM